MPLNLKFILFVSVLLLTPSLWNGLQLDDYFHWGLVQSKSEFLLTQSPASWKGLFSFLDGNPNRIESLTNVGLIPWWTFPELEYAFWRPLTELTHMLDYWAWPSWPAIMHIQSLIYFALMIGAGFVLFRRVQAEPKAWLYAAFFFAVFYGHGVPAGWLANRNALLATLFSLLTLIAHDHWRSQGAMRSGLVAVACFILGLLSGELAVGVGGYLLAYALCYDQASWRSRLMSIAPYVFVGMFWLSMRTLLGYGAKGSGHYIDPLSSPLLFVEVLFTRMLDLVAGLVWIIPSEFATSLPDIRHLLVLAASAIALWLIWPLLRADRTTRFWLVGAIISLVPVAGTIPHSRLLTMASLGISGCLGAMLAFRSWQSESGGRSLYLGRRLLCVVLVVLHGPVSAVLLSFESVSMRLLGNYMVNDAAKNWSLDGLPEGATAVLINPPLSSAGGYINGARAYFGLPVPGQTWLLASGIEPLKLTVVDEYSLELESLSGIYKPVETVLRGDEHAFTVGDQVKLSGANIQIQAVDKGLPTRVRLTFDQPLSNERVHRFYHWGGGI